VKSAERKAQTKKRKRQKRLIDVPHTHFSFCMFKEKKNKENEYLLDVYLLNREVKLGLKTFNPKTSL